MSEMLVCKGLTKTFGPVRALDGVDLTLETGKIVGLLGPNGSGKTTLIKIVNGLLRPTSGEVTVRGMAPGTETKALISYLPDRDFFPDWMTVSDMIGLFSDFYKDFNSAKAEDMCRSLGLELSARVKTGTVLISTHLISDVEAVLDEAVFLRQGKVVLHESVDSIRERTGQSVDTLFREMFRMGAVKGGEIDVR